MSDASRRMAERLEEPALDLIRGRGRRLAEGAKNASLRTPFEHEVAHLVLEQLEARLGSTRQRKFFGAFEPGSGDYRACVGRRDDDDPAALGLETDVLPGGSYLRARLRGEPPAVYERIGPTFVEMAKSAPGDSSRPSIEFYRRSDEIDLLLPVE